MAKILNQKTTADSVIKKDYHEKCDGSIEYLTDRIDRRDDLLQSRLYRSSEAAAEILSVDLPELPDGYYIIGAKDIKGPNIVRIIAEDQPIFADKQVTYIGEPIFLIAGKDRAVVEQIHNSIKVVYKKQTAILDFHSCCDRNLSHLVSYHLGSSRNEVLEIEKKAHSIKIETISTSRQEHVYLEPQAIMGYADSEGRITVEGSLQCPYYVKNALISALDLPEDGVRVIQSPTGGAFGGKEEYPSQIGCQVAVAASVIGKPVLLHYSRHEDMLFTTKRHPSVVRHRTSLDKEGNILAMNIEVYLDGGANEGLSSVVLQRAMINCIGVYSIPHVSAEGHVVFTNNVPNGAFRGFGAPQTIAAIEAHLVHIARDFNIDPLEYKQRYMVTDGLPWVTI